MSSWEPAVQGSTWRKSRYSMNDGNCVEVASVADGVKVRDSASPARMTLEYSAQAWRAFISDLKDHRASLSG
jgi:hypothetical protein